MTFSLMAERCNAEWHLYALYAKCPYAECRGAVYLTLETKTRAFVHRKLTEKEDLVQLTSSIM
jgi:hypothetical protein